MCNLFLGVEEIIRINVYYDYLEILAFLFHKYIFIGK